MMNIAKLVHLNTHPVQFGKSCPFTFTDEYFTPLKVMPTARHLIMMKTTIDPMPWIKPEIFLRTGATTHDELVKCMDALQQEILPGMMLVDAEFNPIQIVNASGVLLYTVLYKGKLQRMTDFNIRNLIIKH